MKNLSVWVYPKLSLSIVKVFYLRFICAFYELLSTWIITFITHKSILLENLFDLLFKPTWNKKIFFLDFKRLSHKRNSVDNECDNMLPTGLLLYSSKPSYSFSQCMEVRHNQHHSFGVGPQTIFIKINKCQLCAWKWVTRYSTTTYTWLAFICKVYTIHTMIVWLSGQPAGLPTAISMV